MADHVGIRKVHDDHVEGSLLGGFDDGIGDCARTHFRLQVVRGNFWGRNHDTIFAGKRLLHPAVEEIRDVGILFSLGDAQVTHIEPAHHVGENIRH